MRLDELTAQLQRAYGGDLVAVMLYGPSASTDRPHPGFDANVLVIVERLGMEQLRAAAAVARAWGEGGNAPPLTLTRAEWMSSIDIFPMEYADVLDLHRVLYGALPSSGMRVNPRDLRHELEHEAMGNLLALRGAIMGTGGDSWQQLELAERALSTLMTVFRAVLRLHGETPDADYERLSRAVAARTGLDAEPFVRVAQHVRGGRRLVKAESGEILAGFLRGMERLVAHLDRFDPASGAPRDRE